VTRLSLLALSWVQAILRLLLFRVPLQDSDFGCVPLFVSAACFVDPGTTEATLEAPPANEPQSSRWFRRASLVPSRPDGAIVGTATMILARPQDAPRERKSAAIVVCVTISCELESRYGHPHIWPMVGGAQGIALNSILLSFVAASIIKYLCLTFSLGRALSSEGVMGRKLAHGHKLGLG